MKIEIVDDVKKRMKEDNKYVRGVLSGRVKARKAVKTLLVTPEIFAQIFSAERIRLMKKVKEKRMNIYQLAKKLSRKYEAVHRDVKLLEGYGLIKVSRSEGKSYPELGKVVAEI